MSLQSPSTPVSAKNPNANQAIKIPPTTTPASSVSEQTELPDINRPESSQSPAHNPVDAFYSKNVISSPWELINKVNQGEVTGIWYNPKDPKASLHVALKQPDGKSGTATFYENPLDATLNWKPYLALALNQNHIPITAAAMPLTSLHSLVKTTALGGLGALGAVFLGQQIWKDREVIWEIPLLANLRRKKPKEQVTLADIGGLSDEIRTIREQVIAHILEAQKAKTQADKLKALRWLPRGVMLAGPPGTGKTMIAEAIAGTTKAKIIRHIGSEFASGDDSGVRRLRSVFDDARRSCMRNGKITGHALIFIDEIDTMDAQSMNQLLALMDGFDKQPPCITVIGATNHLNRINKSLLRKGRFGDLILKIDYPYSPQSRKEIFDLKVRKYLDEYLDPTLKKDYERIALDLAKRMPMDMSGAKIERMITETYSIAKSRWQANPQTEKKVTLEDLLNAYEIAAIGRARFSHRLTPEEKKIVAIHEWAHALMMRATGGEIQAISIIPRGLEEEREASLGRVLERMRSNIHIYTRKDLENDLATLHAGRVGDLFYQGEEGLHTGAASDLQYVRHIAIEGLQKGLYPQLFQAATDSEQQKAKFDQAINKVVDTSYKAVHSFYEALHKAVEISKLQNLYDTLIKEGSLNNPDKIHALIDTLGINLNKLWQEIGEPIMKTI